VGAQWVRSNLSARSLPHRVTAATRTASSSSNVEDVFWTGVGLLMSQFDGLAYAHANLVPPSYALDEITLYLLNSVGDLEDLNGLFPAADAPQGRYPHDRRAPRNETGLGGTSDPIPLAAKLTDCSGLVKVLPDLSDVVVGHTTWRSYYAMLRVFKWYGHLPNTPMGGIAISSSPGLLVRACITASVLHAPPHTPFPPSWLRWQHSKDDWYATSRFVVQETTNSVFNKTLVRGRGGGPCMHAGVGPSIVPTTMRPRSSTCTSRRKAHCRGSEPWPPT